MTQRQRQRLETKTIEQTRLEFCTFEPRPERDLSAFVPRKHFLLKMSFRY
jgi:hypothetical protein